VATPPSNLTAVRLLLAVAALLALTPAVARAQAADTRNRALIVLDASKSMNEDSGSGGTRLDAAKAAVNELVARLPAGAPIGLRVYGSKVAETSRAEACKDTELAIPVGPLDKDKLRGTVNALTGKGRTPIGASLLATPDDLGSGEGRRSVILVSDGGDNCAPPDPCDAAAEVSKQGVDLSISVVGLQVNERVRRQLQCIADAGGGSYTDVQDAGELGDELAALLTRAFRSYDPAGTKVEGTAESEDAPSLGPGQFQDAFPADELGPRWYALDVPEGTRPVVSVTAIPAYLATGGGGIHTVLFDPDGEEVAREQGVLYAGQSAGEAGATVTQSLRTDGPVPKGRYTLSVELPDEAFDTVLPLELGIQYLRPREGVGLTLPPGKVATPTPTATPRVTVTAAPSGSGDRGVNWALVAGLAVAGVLVGLAAAAVLGRRLAT
jgi:hypothetical protein